MFVEVCCRSRIPSPADLVTCLNVMLLRRSSCLVAERAVAVKCERTVLNMMLWVLGFVAAAAAVNNNQVPRTGFSCDGRTTGYYADVESGCQVYHMCDGLGRQFSYTCPNATLFQQRMLICDHWYMVNCSKSVDDYTANLRIGRKMPFVDDSESNPYHRTPRPDLLSHPSQSEYDIIYRTGRAQFGTNLNLVGAESDKNNSTSSTTDESTYSLPSHWSTEYDQQPTTAKSNKIVFNPKKNIDNSGTIKGKPIVPINSIGDNPVNFRSNFKATTPVYPTSVDVISEAPDEAGLLPPLPYQIASHANKESEISEVVTTVSPIQVNFQSDFKATTPVYPKTVDVTSEEPADVGVVPPNSDANNIEPQIPTIHTEILPPAIGPDFSAANQTNETVAAPVLPSQYYEPPKFEQNSPTGEKPQEEEDHARQTGFKALNSAEWDDLRKKFFIPDYDFPLESVSRPSYDSVLSSFQAGEGPSKK